jgi:hypothetical protein
MNTKPWLAALALVAAPLAAQHPGMGQGAPGPMGQMMMAGPMMQHLGPAMMKMMMYAPQHLLARKDALGLTADQVSRLTALRDGTKAAQDAAESEAQAHVKEMEQAAAAPKPDTSALKLHFQAAHNAMGKAHWAMLASAAQARAVLTDAQGVKVQAWADSMQAWMQQHQKMMNPAPSH